MREVYLYQTVHVLDGECLCLREHLAVLDRWSRTLFGCPGPQDAREVGTAIAAVAGREAPGSDRSKFVRLVLPASGSLRLEFEGVSLYRGYDLRSLMREAVTLQYEPPLFDAPTSAREAAVELARQYAGLQGASVAVRCDRNGTLMAADEAVKGTNTEVVSIELPRDTKGGAGHGSLIVFGGEDVSDVKRAVEVALKELDRTFGDVYANDAGHIELQYTARASFALEKAFGAPIGKSCGVIVGAPASIGVLMADTAVKSANVDVIAYSSPAHGTSFSNEAILIISGDSGAVRQAVISAREIGKTLLGALGDEPTNTRPSYI